MAYALNTHFQYSGPEGWHFHAKHAKQNTMTAVQMHNEVRLLSKPEWFHRYLFDLIATQSMHVCKPLPRPEAALLASCWRQLKPVATRRKIEETAEEQYNPKVMHDGLFQQLKIHPLQPVAISANWHTGTHAHRHMGTRAHTGAQAHRHTGTHAHTRTHACAHARAHTHTHTHTLEHTRSPKHPPDPPPLSHTAPAKIPKIPKNKRA